MRLISHCFKLADEKCDTATKKVRMMVIKRDRYLKQVIDKKKNGMIKIITGIRRCGKSYLLPIPICQTTRMKESVSWMSCWD